MALCGVQRDCERYGDILKELFNRKDRVMECAAVIKGRKFIEQITHKLNIFHCLTPIVELFYFRMLRLDDLERRRNESQRIPNLMCDHGHCSVMVFQKLGYDLSGVFIFFH